MYIPRPAKLLFTVDDGWNLFLEKSGDSISPWIRLSVERMLACGTATMGIRRYCCSSPGCSHNRFFCQSCKSKACSSCGFKATEQWVSQQSHILPDCDWQHITFTIPHLLWPFFNNNWPCLMPCSALPPAPCSSGPANRVWRSASSARCTPMVATSTSIRTFICPSPAADPTLSTVSDATSSSRSTPWRKSGAGPPSGCCVSAIT